MAKELPYFQFEPAEYLTKDISFCTLSAQGLFINLCSYYWQRECKLTKEQFLRRLNNPKEFQELVDEGVIDLEQNVIVIKFLDDQYINATKQRKTNSINGSKGGRPKIENPKETQTKAKENPNESQTKGIREDKIREDIIYSEKDFLIDWAKIRKHYMKQETNIKKLIYFDRLNFNEAVKDYTATQIKDALICLFKQENKNIKAMYLQPSHFLDNVGKYVNGAVAKEYQMYGSNQSKTQL